MERTTYLFHAIDSAKNKIQYDTEVKRVLSDKSILAWILKYTVTELQSFTIPEIITCIEGEPEIMTVPIYPGSTPLSLDSSSPSAINGAKNEDAVPNEGKIAYDIRFYVILPSQKTSSGKRIKLILNIEAQKNYYPGYDLVTRAIFYCARMLSAQLDTEFTAEHYNDMKKVYSIWICMDSPSYAENTITEYKIEPHNRYGTFHQKTNYDLLSAVLVCLSRKDASKGNPLHQLLFTLLSTQLSVKEKAAILSNQYQLEMTKTIEEGIETMCNLSDLIEEQGRQQGIQLGVEQGRQQGIEAMILDNLEEGFPADKIIKKLQKRFTINESLAWKYFEQFSNKD